MNFLLCRDDNRLQGCPFIRWHLTEGFVRGTVAWCSAVTITESSHPTEGDLTPKTRHGSRHSRIVVQTRPGMTGSLVRLRAWPVRSYSPVDHTRHVTTMDKVKVNAITAVVELRDPSKKLHTCYTYFVVCHIIGDASITCYSTRIFCEGTTRSDLHVTNSFHLRSWGSKPVSLRKILTASDTWRQTYVISTKYRVSRRHLHDTACSSWKGFCR